MVASSEGVYGGSWSHAGSHLPHAFHSIALAASSRDLGEFSYLSRRILILISANSHAHLGEF